MKIHNIRLGFANNSSSSHSIIFLPDPNLKELPANQRVAVKQPRKVDGEYGWDSFCLDTPVEKADYLLTGYYNTLPQALTDTQRDAIMHELFGVSVGEGYIDHQSLDELSLQGDEELFSKFFNFIVNNPAVTIYGGNDNDDSRYQGPGKKVTQPWFPDSQSCWNNPIRYKEEFGNIVLFNKKTGAKTRAYWGLNPNPPSYDKAIVPELVDIKITDQCKTNCSFCYQGSTETGKHGDTDFIISLLNDLDELGVFEVAIGGGEPTLHPGFKNIFGSYCSGSGLQLPNGMKRNLTTYDMSFADKGSWDSIRDRIKYQAGSFAISNCSQENLKKLVSWNKENAVQGSIQLIEGVQTKDGVDRMLAYLLELAEENRLGLPRITLLGYKTTGRGGNYTTKNSDWLGDLLKGVVDWRSDYRKFSWAIDTQIVKNFAPELLSHPEVLYHREEGKFSCYIDAVTRRVYPSSYELDGPSFEYTTPQAFLEGFAKF